LSPIALLFRVLTRDGSLHLLAISSCLYRWRAHHWITILDRKLVELGRSYSITLRREEARLLPIVVADQIRHECVGTLETRVCLALSDCICVSLLIASTLHSSVIHAFFILGKSTYSASRYGLGEVARL